MENGISYSERRNPNDPSFHPSTCPIPNLLSLSLFFHLCRSRPPCLRGIFFFPEFHLLLLFLLILMVSFQILISGDFRYIISHPTCCQCLPPSTRFDPHLFQHLPLGILISITLALISFIVKNLLTASLFALDP